MSEVSANKSQICAAWHARMEANERAVSDIKTAEATEKAIAETEAKHNQEQKKEQSFWRKYWLQVIATLFGGGMLSIFSAYIATHWFSKSP